MAPRLRGRLELRGQTTFHEENTALESRTQPRSPVPMPIPADTQGVILFGGSFDPPQRAHVQLAVEARGLVSPGAWLVFVPAARSPMKDEPPRVTGEQRMEMLTLALVGVDRAAVWSEELERARDRAGEPSYWIKTLRAARSLAGAGARLWFIIGADQARVFHRWREPREILGLAEPIVLPREPESSAGAVLGEMARSGYWSADELARWERSVLSVPTRTMSSTLVRSLLREGGDAAKRALEDAISPGVAAYISEHRLYREA